MPDLLIAASEDVLQRLFAAVRDAVQINTSGQKRLGRFIVGWDIGAHLKGGSLDLRDPPPLFPGFPTEGWIQVKELDIKWHTLRLMFGLDIPSFCVGGWCIIPTPWGCALELPKKCFFESDVDVSATLDLSGFLTSEVSLGCRLEWKHTLPRPTTWNLHLIPRTVDIDLIDIADTVGDLIDALIHALVDDLLSFLPDWVRDIIETILGALSDLIRAILDIEDDVFEWLSELLGVSLGLFDLIAQLVGQAIAEKHPIHKLPDPFTMFAPDTSQGLPAVKIPIDVISASVTDTEIILSATIGA